MSSYLQAELTKAENYFKKAREQVVQLNRRLDALTVRYDNATRENRRSFRYSIKMRMSVTENVRNMYAEYAGLKANYIQELKSKLADLDHGSTDSDGLEEMFSVEDTDSEGPEIEIDYAEEDSVEDDSDDVMVEIDNAEEGGVEEDSDGVGAEVEEPEEAVVNAVDENPATEPNQERNPDHQ